MNVFESLDHVLGVTTAVERRGRSDDLVTEIADALVAAGEYVTRVDLMPTQQVVDFNWAAHQAGRNLGIRIQVEVKVAKADPDGRAQVWVRPQSSPA
jgi:hypothetical protein